MREISNDEMGKIFGGVKPPRRISKQPDDGGIKLHPVPYPRDGDPRIPTDPGRVPSGANPDIASASPAIPTSTTSPIQSDAGRRPRKQIRYVMGFNKNSEE